MAGENVKTLTRIYEAWAQGDFTVGAEAFDPTATLVIDPDIPDSGVFVGPDQIRGYMTNFLDAWDKLTITAESIKDAGDTIMVAVRQTGIGKDSGAQVGLSYFQVWTFRGESVVRLESILQEAKALEALDKDDR